MWIVITLFAAGFQIARTSEQHRLRAVLGVAEAGYVRFVYALPMAAILTSGWFLGPGEIPEFSRGFWPAVFLAGITQILGTLALLQSFRLRGFAVGTVYSKTEVVFVGAASAVWLSEPLSALAWAGVVVCLLGVMWLASEGKLRERLTAGLDPSARYGILAGGMFALAATGIRAASADLDGGTISRAATTLTAMLAIQTLVQGVALGASSKSSLRRVAGAWRQAVPVAVLSLGGSIGWALAITLENAARVRTLGQIEIVFAFLIGAVAHRESHRWHEYAAGAVATSGILLVVLA